MDKELRKAIKKLLLIDSIIDKTYTISDILDEVEEELEDIFNKGKKDTYSIEDLFNLKLLK